MALRIQNARQGAVALLLCCLLVAAGCKTSEDASAAATQMAQTAKTLTDYYAGLDKVLQQTDQLNGLLEAVSAIPYDDAGKKQIAEAEAEIGRREKLAASLSELAESFSSLASPAGVKAANDSASKLQTELESIKQFEPAAPAIDVAVSALQMVMTAVQEHKEREAARAMSEAVAGLDAFFMKEAPLYESLHSQYLRTARRLAISLVNGGQVDESTLVKDAVGPFDLSPSVTSPELKGKIHGLMVKRIEARVDEQRVGFGETTTAMEQAMAEMARRIDLVARKKPMTSRMQPVTLGTVQRWAEAVPGR